MSKDDLSPGDDRLILPASWRVVGPDAQSPGALSSILDAADTIQQFVYRQRQAARNSVIEQHRAHLDTPGVDVRYYRNQGEERIELRPYTSSSRVIEGTVSPEPTSTNPVPLQTQDQITLYLLVLYKTSKYAIFPMTSLSVGIDGKATANLTASADLVKQGAAFGTDNIYVNQLMFGTTSVIYAGVDLTGKGKGDKLYLCTPSLKNTFETDQPNTSLPFMNGTGQDGNATIYTGLSSYRFDGKAFSTGTGNAQTTDITGASNVGFAYDPDGTTYFPGDFSGSAGLTIDRALLPSIGTQVSDAFKLVTEMQTPTSAVYYTFGHSNVTGTQNKLTILNFGTYAAITSYLYGYDNRSYTLSNSSDSSDDTTLYCGGGPITDTPIPVSVQCGLSYYASCPYGGTPVLHNLKIAFTPGLYPAYDSSLNASTQHLGTQESADLSGVMPRSVYDTIMHTVSTVLDPVVSTSSITHSVVQSKPVYPKDTGINPPPSYETFSGGTNITYVDYPATFNGREADTNGAVTNCFAWVNKNTMAGMQCSNDSTPEGLRADAKACQTISGPVFTEMNSQSGYHQTTTYSGAGFLSEVSVVTVTNAGVVVHQGDVTQGYPGVGSAKDTTTPVGNLAWHGVSIDQMQSLTVYSFPLSLSQAPKNNPSNETCFYTISKAMQVSKSTSEVITITPASGSTVETHTPYGMFNDTLSPWLHICNHQHYMQGFMIGTSTGAQNDPANKALNHLYLDGGDFMPYLTSVLSSAAVPVTANDIVAAFMDVPLSSVQQLAKITSVMFGSAKDTP